MKIAVVGSGPAAVAVIAAIHGSHPQAKVTVFDHGTAPQYPIAPPPANNPTETAYLTKLYQYLHRSHGWSFPPPKTQYGFSPAKAKVGEKNRVWASAGLGGLSQIWGASVFPLTDRELASWPLGLSDLEPYYTKVADMIGISGADDGLSDYFGGGYVNRPATNLLEPFQKLSDAIHGKQSATEARFVSGVARLALETRPEMATSCISCGGCMTGCSRGSVYVAASDFERLKAEGAIDKHITAKVLSFDKKNRSLLVQTAHTEKTFSRFDRIYIAAGCLGTSEIVMRSLQITDGPSMQDNAVFTFPILNLGRKHPGKFPESAQVLTNLVIGRVPRSFDESFTQIQIYASFNHLWRYYLPAWSWPMADWFGKVLQRRLLWGRLYLTGGRSASYDLHLNSQDQVALELKDEGGAKSDVLAILEDLRSALKGSGFFVPKGALIRHGTSSHYAATFPYGEGRHPTSRTGEIAPDIYLCDASVFNESPSISPTLTIMANAWRTVEESLRPTPKTD